MISKEEYQITNPIQTLSLFLKNNPQCRINHDENKNKIVIENPWDNTDGITILLEFQNEKIEELNNILINPLFDAIIHIDQNQIEFIYGFIDPKDESDALIIDRKFEILLNGERYTCYFKEPSERMLLLAKGFRRQHRILGQDYVPQMMQYKDFLNKDTLPEPIQKYFENRIPRNFYIESEKKIDEVDLVKVARHVNFIMRYYDRESPTIEIRQKVEKSNRQTYTPKQLIEDRFPTVANIREIDEYLLQLIEVARNTTPRFAFIYYYQVIEYAAFYYLDSKVKKDLKQILRNPTFIECSDNDVSQLFTYLCEKMENDDVKMQKVIEEYCDPSVIWKEIEHNKDFFSTLIEFEGDVKIEALIASDTTEETWKKMWMPQMYKYFTKIRNSIAHAREKRQSNVISPCASNSLLLYKVLPLIRRTAEMIALIKE